VVRLGVRADGIAGKLATEVALRNTEGGKLLQEFYENFGK